jgi:hypothetical protein
MEKTSVLILTGEHAPVRQNVYLYEALANRWKSYGLKIQIHKGPRNVPNADLVLLHVDLTHLPEEYDEALQGHPLVLNRKVKNISKKNISHNLISQQTDYQGAVIVKTDNNFGGIPEARTRMNRFALPPFFKPSWKKVKSLDAHNYPIYAHKSDVPPGIWTNPHLVVEKFLPEIENNLYYIRYYIFLGDKHWVGRFGSKHPVVKFNKMVTEDQRLEVPEELRKFRENMGFDYGRFDYVVHDGKIILLDINKTLGGADHLEAYKKELDYLAEGIKTFL